MLSLLISLVLTAPQFSVNVPDSVQVGAAFSCEISVSGENLTSVDCIPVFSDELQYLGSGSMQSYSSVTTPAGRAVSSEIQLSMSFAALSSGAHTIGPLVLTSSGRRLVEIPLLTVVSSRDAGRPAGNTGDLRSEEIAWMDIEFDTTGRIFPGQTFNIDYYVYKTRHNAEVVDLFLEPSDYASSNLIGDVLELQWIRCKDGVYRTLLTTLEITPAFACTLSLPVLTGRVALPGRTLSPAVQTIISTEGFRIPVYPFPERGRPTNFSGITDEIIFNTDRIRRGYSAAGEKCIQISITGPGYSQLKEAPAITVQGPAEVLFGNRFSLTDNSNAWYVLVTPTDSGTVIIGPDSVPWFDTSAEEYMQALIPSCTLSVYPSQNPIAEIPVLSGTKVGASITWILTVSALLIVITFITLRYRNRLIGVPPEISETTDIEELLTSMGYQLSELLTGTRSYMGAEELDEALDNRTIDAILARRLLRHWKDLELMLTGRIVSAQQLEKLKRKSNQLIRELGDELDTENPS